MPANRTNTLQFILFLNFRPDRFVLEGQVFDKLLAEKVNVHGSGRRLCPGYSISKIQAFVSIATFLRHFDFTSLDQDNLKLPNGSMTITVVPDEFNVRVSLRSNKT